MSFYCIIAQNNIEVFDNYIMPGLQKWEVDAAISMDSIPGIKESIFKKYNDGIKTFIERKYPELLPTDIIAFCHEDVKLLDPFFIPKIQLVFKQREDVGLCGVVGTIKLNDTGAWWQNSPNDLRGHIMQENGENCSHLIKGPIGFYDDLVAVDGLCFFIRASLFLDGLRFDDATFDGFDFYDIDICMQVLKHGYKIACVDVLLQHKSIGDISKSQSWHIARDKFIAKWKTEMSFPITQKSFIESNIVEIEV